MSGPEISRKSLHEIFVWLGILTSGFGSRVTTVTGLAVSGPLPGLNDVNLIVITPYSRLLDDPRLTPHFQQ
jgi:hypothetical protein